MKKPPESSNDVIDNLFKTYLRRELARLANEIAGQIPEGCAVALTVFDPQTELLATATNIAERDDLCTILERVISETDGITTSLYQRRGDA